MTDERLKGRYLRKRGVWAWQRRRNGLQVIVSLGRDEARAKELCAECNRLFDEGATQDAIRLHIIERTKSPTVGLRLRKQGNWQWERGRNGLRVAASLGRDEARAKELCAECNRLFDEGATQDAIRLHIIELQATVDLDHLKPPAEAQPLIELGMAWVTGARHK